MKPWTERKMRQTVPWKIPRPDGEEHTAADQAGGIHPQWYLSAERSSPSAANRRPFSRSSLGHQVHLDISSNSSTGSTSTRCVSSCGG